MTPSEGNTRSEPVLDEIYAVQRDDWEAWAAMAGEQMVSKSGAIEAIEAFIDLAAKRFERFRNMHAAHMDTVEQIEWKAQDDIILANIRRELAELRAGQANFPPPGSVQCGFSGRWSHDLGLPQEEHVGTGGDKAACVRDVEASWREKA